MLVGRSTEVELLNRIYKDNVSHFVAIYVRLRIGKTYLINEVFKDSILFHHSGVANGNLKEQLFAFSASLKNSNYKPNNKISNCKDNEALRCYKELLDEFEKTHNNERLMSTYSNIGFLYNALNEYTLCIKTLQNALYNVFSPSDSIWISNIVLNYVFACFMISKYAEIINLVTNNLFQYKRLNWVSASIFILACFFFDDFSKASNVISYFKDDENVNAILKYLKTNDLKCLDLIKTTQFSLKIIEKLKCL